MSCSMSEPRGNMPSALALGREVGPVPGSCQHLSAPSGVGHLENTLCGRGLPPPSVKMSQDSFLSN